MIELLIIDHPFYANLSDARTTGSVIAKPIVNCLAGEISNISYQKNTSKPRG